jgi:hypothetical protein
MKSRSTISLSTARPDEKPRDGVDSRGIYAGESPSIKGQRINLRSADVHCLHSACNSHVALIERENQ